MGKSFVRGSIMNINVGANIKSARIYRGYTITELSKRIGISKQILSAYENNKRALTPENKMKLVQVLDFPIDFFEKSTIGEVDKQTVFFRALKSTIERERQSLVESLSYIKYVCEVLEDYVNFPAFNIPDNLLENYSLDIENNYDIIEDITMRLRQFWDIEDRPINNIQDLLERNGIFIIKNYSQNEKIDAFSTSFKLQNGSIIYFIDVLETKSQSRINFDIAHELGHIILHKGLTNEQYSKYFKKIEDDANIFASSFLMPKNSAHTKLKSLIAYKPRFFISVANYFNVSIQAAVYRAKDLGIIDKHTYSSLFRTIVANGWKKREPIDRKGFIRETLIQAAIKLLFENKILTPSLFLEKVNMKGVYLNAEDLEKILDLPENMLKVKKQAEILSLKNIIEQNTAKNTPDGDGYRK